MLCVLLISFLSLPSRLTAQDNPATADLEANYKRLGADVEDLKSSIQSFKQRLTEQSEEIRKLSEELSHAASNKDFATREDFKHLADKIREVDEKRIADNKNLVEKVTAEFAHLGNTLKANPPKTTAVPITMGPGDAATSSPGPKTGSSTPQVKPKGDQKPSTENGFEYTIRMDDNPRVIAKALTAKGIKVTQKQIIEANPNVVWTKLKVGQKIFIPAPAAPAPQ